MSREDDDGSGGSPQNFQQGGAGSQLKGRIVIAMVVALFALIKYLMHGDVNPITGETQRVAIADVNQEAALGQSSAPAMIQQFGGEEPNRRKQARVTQMGEKLVDAMEQNLLKGRPNPYRFQFHLLADPKTVNAFALPGGQVFITDALLDMLETDGQLAGVLGHEIGHVIQRHSNQRMAKQELTQGLVGAAGVAGGNLNAQQAADYVAKLVTLSYGRKDELEADRWGVRLCVYAKYDPHAMLGVMDILDKVSSGNKTPEMMQTHPKPENRKEYIMGVFKDEFPNGFPKGLEP